MTRAVVIGGVRSGVGMTTITTGIMGALGLIVVGVCMCGPSLSSLISQHAAVHERGRLLGVSQSSAGLGRILGPGLSGTAFAALGADSPFYIGAIVMVVMLVLSLRIAGRSPIPKSTD